MHPMMQQSMMPPGRMHQGGPLGVPPSPQTTLPPQQPPSKGDHSQVGKRLKALHIYISLGHQGNCLNQYKWCWIPNNVWMTWSKAVVQKKNVKIRKQIHFAHIRNSMYMIKIPNICKKQRTVALAWDYEWSRLGLHDIKDWYIYSLQSHISRIDTFILYSHIFLRQRKKQVAVWSVVQ